MSLVMYPEDSIMAHDIQMPRFAKAGTGGGVDWADGDQFDVEMLAEYLLDDNAMSTSGVTFDFNIENSLQGSGVGSGVVSPENSEDGAMPFVAENRVPAVAPPPPAPAAPPVRAAPQPAPAPLAPVVATPNLFHISALTANPLAAPIAPMSVGAPLASPLTFPTLPVPVGAAPATLGIPGAAGAGLLFPQSVPQGQAPDMNVVKKRRLDAKPGQMPGLPMGVPMLTTAAGGVAPQAAAAAALLNGQQLAVAAAQAMQGRSGGRKKSQAQIDRRRERNRILARRTRLRKKFFFESLQKEVLDLQRENQLLKEIARTSLEEADSKALLEECDAMEKLPPSVLEAIGEHANDMEAQDFSLVKSIQGSQHSFIITDPSLQDNPIVFASDDFLKVTGYTRDQVLGRNCRFLQGTETNAEKVNTIRKALSNGEDVSVTMINYTADGTAFWNKLFIAALRDAQNNIVNFIGVVVRVAGPDPSDPEHGKLLPGAKPEADDDNDDDFV